MTGCNFDMFVFYTADSDRLQNGHVGEFRSNSQALFFCPGGATRMADELHKHLGEGPPDWLIRDITAGTASKETKSLSQKVRFAVPSLFQHGCLHSPYKKKTYVHKSNSFRFPAVSCHGFDHVRM